MNREATIEIIVTLPGMSHEPIRRAITIDEEFTRAITPLPRGREIPFNFIEQRIARDMTLQRQQIAEWAGRKLASEATKAILEAIESQDPQHGYSPEQWAELNRKPTPHPDTK